MVKQEETGIYEWRINVDLVQKWAEWFVSYSREGGLNLRTNIWTKKWVGWKGRGNRETGSCLEFMRSSKKERVRSIKKYKSIRTVHGSKLVYKDRKVWRRTANSVDII